MPRAATMDGAPASRPRSAASPAPASPASNPAPVHAGHTSSTRPICGREIGDRVRVERGLHQDEQRRQRRHARAGQRSKDRAAQPGRPASGLARTGALPGAQSRGGANAARQQHDGCQPAILVAEPRQPEQPGEKPGQALRLEASMVSGHRSRSGSWQGQAHGVLVRSRHGTPGASNEDSHGLRHQPSELLAGHPGPYHPDMQTSGARSVGGSGGACGL